MTRTLVRTLLALATSACLSACGTIISAVHPEEKLEPYSGTRLMAGNFHGGVLDVPFSFIADTLLVPVTVPKALIEQAGRPAERVEPASTTSAAAAPNTGTLASSSCVAIYLLPLDDFAFEDAAALAKRLAADLRIPVKATLPMGDMHLQQLPRQVDSVQFSASEIMRKTHAVAVSLPQDGAPSHAIALTWRDINDPRQDLRFLFSQHMPDMRTSVVSGGRMRGEERGLADHSRAIERVYKMLKRTAGEYCLGIPRSTDTSDVMYSPIMSLRDLDAIGTAFLPNLRAATSSTSPRRD